MEELVSWQLLFSNGSFYKYCCYFYIPILTSVSMQENFVILWNKLDLQLYLGGSINGRLLNMQPY
ncbi:hypothetical protein SAMN05443246_5700 [Paenibacillus sp. GP183]|nr:hypothetical protein SAMN05443246_5700 [Paenibacillus sp. GP183]